MKASLWSLTKLCPIVSTSFSTKYVSTQCVNEDTRSVFINCPGWCSTPTLALKPRKFCSRSFHTTL